MTSEDELRDKRTEQINKIAAILIPYVEKIQDRFLAADKILAWHNKETEKLQARIKELEEALKNYGEHKADCGASP